MKKILILMSVAMLFTACQKENQLVGVVKSLGTTILVEDENGVDLLSPSHAQQIDASKIKVYASKDGQYHIYESLFDRTAPNAPMLEQSNYDGFAVDDYIQSGSTSYHVHLSVLHMELEDYYKNGDVVPTIVDWGNGVKDKLEVRVKKIDDKGYFGYDKMWINGKLVWDRTKIDWYDDQEQLKGSGARLVMSEGSTSSTGYSYLKALQ